MATSAFASNAVCRTSNRTASRLCGECFPAAGQNCSMLTPAGGEAGGGDQRLREDLRAVGARLERESVASREDGRWLPTMYVQKLALAEP